MKKYLFTICCIICIILITSISAITANNYQFISYRADYSILVNGELVTFNSPLIRADNRVYVSLRDISEFLGYEVLYDGWESQISLQDEEHRETLLFYTSFQGVLSNGIRYQFEGRDRNAFDLNRFRQGRRILDRYEFDNVEIMQTPSEAAEVGFRHLGIPFGENYSVVVFYCSETNNWIVRASTGMPRVTSVILAINRIDGSIVRYVAEY